jgi:hypothetical protein
LKFVVGLVALAGVAAAMGATAAEPPATVTLTDGRSTLLRGTARFAIAEGVRVQSGDIIETSDKSLAQIEFADGVVLSLGPKSRFYAQSLIVRTAKGGPASDFYLLQGWTKFANGKAAAPFRYTTPHFGLGSADATAVLQVEQGEASLFVESGEVRLVEGFTKASPTSPVRLRGGEFFTRKGDQKGIVQARPAPAFVASMPKVYFDNLPARFAKFKDRDVAPRRLDDPTYAEVETWLKLPLELRRPFVQRFTPKATEDQAFRQAVVANMKSHPEWDRILFPDKYKPKPPPEPPKVAAPPAPPQPEPPSAAFKPGEPFMGPPAPPQTGSPPADGGASGTVRPPKNQ